MDTLQHLSCLSFDLRIIRAKDIEFKPSGLLFVRCYLSAGNNTRIRLNTKEMPFNSDFLWNQSFSLECSGESMKNSLFQGNVIFELRRRSTKTAPFLGGIRGSQLLGRAEMPWSSLMESQEMRIQKWVPMIPARRRVDGDAKPPAIEIEMKIGVPAAAEEVVERRRKAKWEDSECRCGKCGVCSFADYDIFAMVAACDGLSL